MIQKVLGAVIAILLVALLAVGYHARQTGGEAREARQKLGEVSTQLQAAEDALRAAKAAEAAARALSVERLRQLETSKAQERASTKALNEALQADPEWAGAAVPDGVRNSLSRPGTAR